MLLTYVHSAYGYYLGMPLMVSFSDSQIASCMAQNQLMGEPGTAREIRSSFGYSDDFYL